MAEKRSINVQKAKKAIIDVGMKCWQKGWVASNDGNISYRIGENEILCTPTCVSKGMLTMNNLCTVDMDGKLIHPSDYLPSSELKMHLRVFRERPDVGSVFHAHPPYATAHAVAGIPLTECIMPEIVIGLGSIPLVPYGTPSTEEIPDRLTPFVKDYDAWLLESHGALTAGADPYHSYFRMESLELYAQVLFIAKSLGAIKVLDPEKVRSLIPLRKGFGVENKDNIPR